MDNDSNMKMDRSIEISLKIQLIYMTGINNENF